VCVMERPNLAGWVCVTEQGVVFKVFLLFHYLVSRTGCLSSEKAGA